MARGVVIGQVTGTDGKPLTGADVALSGVNGADSNGRLIQTTVPMADIVRGGWFTSTTFRTDRRLTDAIGVFVLPFSWDEASPDNQARAAGLDLLDVKVTVIPGDNTGAYKTFRGPAVYVLDLPKLLDNIKSAKSMLEGPGKETLKSLTGEMRKAIKGDEFESIHRSMFSTSQHAIVGVLAGLQM